MNRLLIAALCLWTATARAADLNPKTVEVWKGIELNDAGLAPLPQPAKLAFQEDVATTVADDASGLYTTERGLVSVDKFDYTDPATKKPLQATAKSTNLFLQINPATKKRRIIARDGANFSEVLVVTPEMYKKPVTIVAQSVKIGGTPYFIPLKPAATVVQPKVDGDKGLTNFEKTILREKMLDPKELTLKGTETLASKPCAEGYVPKDCRSHLVKSVTPALTDAVAQDNYLQARLGADYKDLYAPALKEAADKNEFSKKWHEAAAGEVKAYIAAPDKFDHTKADPFKKLLDALRQQKEAKQQADAQLAELQKTELGKALVKLLGVHHEAIVEATVIDAYYRGKNTTDEDLKTIQLAAAGDKDAKAKFEDIRKNVAAKTRDFLDKEERDATSPFAKLNNDNVLLEHYCGAVGHSLANQMTKAQAEEKLNGPAMQQAVGQALCGTTLDGNKACTKPGERADQRCSHFKQPHGPRPDPTTDQTGPRTPGPKTFVPGPTGGPVDPPADKSDKLNLYNGIKGAIMGAIIGGILLGPAGLLLGAAVLGFAGWYMSKDANEK